MAAVSKGHLPFILLALWVAGTMAAISPETLTDKFGNTADKDSKITWVPFTGRLPYNKYEAYNDGGLAPLFNLARSVINTVLPGDLPYDIIKGIILGTFDIGSQWSEMLTKNFMGIAILFAIGILFIIFFPLVGCCFACCRCCNNCGGRKQQDYSKYFLHKRVIFAVFLALCAIFICVGAICIFVTSAQIPTAVKETDKSAQKALQDADTYLNNTIQEVEYLAKDGYSFTKTVIYRDLDNIAELVGVPVRDQLATAGGINAAIDSMVTFDASIANLTAAMVALNDSYNTLVASSDELYYQVNAAKYHLEEALKNCPPAQFGVTPANCGVDPSQLEPTFNSTNLPDISSQMNLVNQVRGQNLTALALSAKVVFDDIPETVYNESKSTIDAMRPLLDSIETTIDTALNTIKPMANLSLSTQSAQVSTYTDLYLQYDNYRNYATIALASLILCMVAMIIIGLLFGIICSSYKQDPMERGTPSTCGGNCLMASVGFMFIFAPLLMLITSVMFVAGTPMEKYLCVPLKDPTFKVYTELFDGPDFSVLPGTPGYPLGQLIFQNNTVNLTVSGILQGCKDDKAAYKVFAIENLFDITSLLDYQKTIDINKELDKVNVNLSSIALMTPEIKSQFDSLNGSLTLNQTSITEALALNLTTNDLVNFATMLNTTADNYQNTSANASTALRASSEEVMNIQTVNVAAVNNDKDALLAALNNVFAQIPNFEADMNNVYNNLVTTENYLHVQGTADIKTQITAYANRILGVADSFAAYALSSLNNDLGKCGIVWTIYDELTSKVLCSYLVDVVNGFWISLGWALFFFTPSIIFSVKLAKHYRCMKYPGNGYSEKNHFEMNSSRSSSRSSIRKSRKSLGSNKVSPNDNSW